MNCLQFILISTVLSFSYENWLTLHKVKYLTTEYLRRKAVFLDNQKYVEEFNKIHINSTYRLTMKGPYSTLTNLEYRKILLNTNQQLSNFNTYFNSSLLQNLKQEVRNSVDWREEGKVTAIKDQKNCGSCYSFGAVSVIESLILITSGEYEDLSEQQIVDCTSNTKYSNFGCTCGNVGNTFNYIKDVGITTENKYRYIASESNCTVNEIDVKYKIQSYTSIFPPTEDALKIAVNKQPVAVSIDASNPSFQLYKSGIYDEPKCKYVDHVVSVVGYGSQNGNDYWIVKNSWGTEWGDKGYIYMSRNKNNQCGIATIALYPTGIIKV
ncbi:cysteine proteinase 2 precursor, putative [Entamoeba invadens IP1]|uniref:cysteine proteinase 2 precursor, putative n=1 Tax=Entamoeba invadens IP1 TaxID=370355 RepID=UPI0002C3DACE|nr:cysteine proteinase 2 precursor, putative [Entamoeba invadens IP1]ELP93522.1 cysteine proteinase 2 precursor, putative [Entamoeba invadens IP1]|eukprot:XP_004260293.1 cysteine proteinase 2 precursor, putative [Entamoeba invadens IP1]